MLELMAMVSVVMSSMRMMIFEQLIEVAYWTTGMQLLRNSYEFPKTHMSFGVLILGCVKHLRERVEE